MRIFISNETQSVEFDLIIRACQEDVMWLFGKSFCKNKKNYYQPFHLKRKINETVFLSIAHRLLIEQSYFKRIPFETRSKASVIFYLYLCTLSSCLESVDIWIWKLQSDDLENWIAHRKKTVSRK